MTAAPGERALEVGFVLVPGMLSTGTALPYEMWAAAGDRRRVAGRSGMPVSLTLIGAAGEDDPGVYGRLPLRADCGLADAGRLDVIYLPALWRNPLRALVASDRLSPWLSSQYDQGAAIAAVGTGVSLLAASGLLDGRAATTHWYFFERFEREFPEVELKRQFFITQSGSLHCAASINSLADVTVHLIERAFGRDVAQHVERNFSHEIRRTYEEYRYLDGGSSPLDDEAVVEAQMWIQDNLSSRLTVADLAARLGTSPRTLERRFRAATGSSPASYWRARRIAFAKELLESTNLTISDIAQRVGFLDAGHFSRLFRRELSVGPSGYRATVRAKLFRGAPGHGDGVKEADTTLGGRNPAVD